MDNLLIGLDKIWRKIQVVRVTASCLVAKRGGYLISAVAYGDGSAIGLAKVYDGEGTNDPVLFDLGVYANGSSSFSPCFPMPFDRGLYVALSGQITSLTLTLITVGSR